MPQDIDEFEAEIAPFEIRSLKVIDPDTDTAKWVDHFYPAGAKVKSLKKPLSGQRTAPHGWCGNGVLKGPYDKHGEGDPWRYVSVHQFDMKNVPPSGWR